MADVDDWAPVKPADDWRPVASQEPSEERPPQAFLERVKLGQAIVKVLNGINDIHDPLVQSYKDAALSLKQEVSDAFKPLDIDPDSGLAGAYGSAIAQTANGARHFFGSVLSAGAFPFAPIFDAGTWLAGHPIAAAGKAAGEPIAKMLGADPAQFPSHQEIYETIRPDVKEAFWAMMPRRLSRVVPGGEQVIGEMPTEADFKNAAWHFGTERAIPKLKAMWIERGIHPAEAVHDAQFDAWYKNEIINPNPDPALNLPAEAWLPQNLIEAYHGSPHDFEAFDISRIGSGEGAQAYGHGLYFAENEAVARNYEGAEKIHSDRLLKTSGEYGSFQKAMREKYGRAWSASDLSVAEREKLDSLYKAHSEAKNSPIDQGNLYRVRITANKEHFLDWDKPLREQPTNVQSAIQELSKNAEVARRIEGLGDNPTMGQVYGALGRGVTHSNFRGYAVAGEKADAAASNALREAGIPGIKYLDQGSRDTGAGTHNFVLFDDKLVEITHKNGEPLTKAERAVAIDEARTPQSLSAAAQPLPPLVPLSQQPAPPPGRLISAITDGVGKVFDIGRDIQMMIAPMARGTVESMATAKDFANALRRNRWEWTRIDDDIAKRFTPEQRKRMWDAADEESVAIQLGEDRSHQGLVTLEPAERAAVEDLQARAQATWLRARDMSMVEGEGLPAYTPRMVINMAAGDGSPLALNSLGRNLRTRTGQMNKRKYMTAEETEAAAKAAFGADAEIARDIRALSLATAKLEDAIAGRSLVDAIKDYGKRTGDETVVTGGAPAGSEHKWFTIDHPALKTWRPKIETLPNGDPALDGNMLRTVKDADGNVIFEQVPIYIRGDFEGPLRAVLTQPSGPFYGALMALKGKTMSLIMNSPLIHNAVEFGRAFPAMPTRIFKAYFDGNRAKNDPAIMGEAIDNGLVPIGKRFFNQDITSIMEEPDLSPGRSWTAKVLGAVPDLFSPDAGNAVKRAVDKAGDFWHNTLLWDRIADLQMGIYVNMRGDMIAKGVDAQTSSRIAAHLANRYAGALPKEAMSDGATKIANFLMFSRTFTIGNLGVLKDVFTGLPKDVAAQIERDMGVVDPEAVGYAKSMARRKAMMTVGLDIALAYVGYSLFQNASNILLGDSTLEKEFHGYVKRLRDVVNEANVHPLSLLQPLSIVERLSATHENEPGKGDRFKVGHAADGTAIYARNPVGKIGEEFVGYLSSPIDMLKRKEGTIARPLLQVISNDKGFGRKIYDPNAETLGQYGQNIWNIVKHIVAAQTPEGQLNAFADLVKGDGDPKVNAMQAFGPVLGVSFSKGAPGGPAVGEAYHVQAMEKYAVDAAMPDIRKQIQRGDIDGAKARMDELKIAPALQRFYIRTSLNPSQRLSPRLLRDFYRHSTPEQQERLENAK